MISIPITVTIKISTQTLRKDQEADALGCRVVSLLSPTDLERQFNIILTNTGEDPASSSWR
jgi:hypothetical protein